jgi:hypothetical protein
MEKLVYRKRTEEKDIPKTKAMFQTDLGTKSKTVLPIYCMPTAKRNPGGKV